MSLSHGHNILVCGALALVLAVGLGGCKPDAGQSLAEAKALRAKGEHAAAVLQLKNALSADPQNGEARYLLGAELNNLRDGRGAEVEVRRAMDLGFVAGGRVAVELGRALLLRGSYQTLLKEVVP